MTKSANIEAVGAGKTSATFTTTKEGADSVSLDINILVKSEVKNFIFIEANSYPATVEVERGKHYFISFNTGLQDFPAWWPDKSFGSDSDLIPYNLDNFTPTDHFMTEGAGPMGRLVFKVKEDAALGSHALHFSNLVSFFSYVSWTGPTATLPNINNRLMITLNVVEGTQ